MFNLMDLVITKMPTEEKAWLLNNLLINMFDNDDFEVFMAIMEKRYELADEKKKKVIEYVIRHFRELMTLRPRAMEFKKIMKETVEQLKQANEI